MSDHAAESVKNITCKYWTCFVIIQKERDYSQIFQIIVALSLDDEEEVEVPKINNESEEFVTENLPAIQKSNSTHTLKETFSEAMMHSNLYQSLPKYIFQNEHETLKKVKSHYDEAKVQQEREIEMENDMINFDLSEYPIQMIEEQQKALHRQMSIK